MTDLAALDGLDANALIARRGQLRALSNLVDVATKEVERALRAQLERAEAMMGNPGLTVKHAGVGSAYITVPSRAADITRPETFAAWVDTNHPGERSERIGWDHAALAVACASDPDLEERLAAAGAITVEAVYAEALMTKVLPKLPTTEAGDVIDPATGEFAGVRLVERSTRTLNVRHDSAAMERNREALIHRLGRGGLLDDGGE